MSLNLGPIRLLHVDDDPDLTARLAGSLEGDDPAFEVTGATSTRDALRTLRERQFDCVIAVNDLPDESGISLLKTVREAYPELPFFLYTQSESGPVRDDAIAAGTTDYLRREPDTQNGPVLRRRIVTAVEAYRARRAAARERGRFSALFEQFPEPTIAYEYVEDEPIIRSVNEAFEAVFGYDAETATGAPVDDLIVPPERQEEADAVDEQVQAGDPVDETLRRQTADGVRVFRFRNIPVPEADDQDGFAVYTDVTERVERKEALERRNERLDEFASIVGHDLRNPLNVANHRAHLAAEECDSDHLDGVIAAHERMDDLLEGLLQLARHGDPGPDTEPVELDAVAESCWENVPTDDATLVVQTEVTIRADRSRLKQLLENLIRNSVEHGRSDTPDPAVAWVDEDATVTVRVADLDDGFVVADDGPGIPEAEGDRVFETGYSTADDGSGIGLYVVERIVDAHDWEIDVTDSTAGGARFEITDIETP